MNSPGNINFNLGKYQSIVENRVTVWENSQYFSKLWEKDTSLWSSEPIEEIVNRLGWLELPEKIEKEIEGFKDFLKTVRKDNIKHVVLLGMGGSSLGPEMFSKIFGSKPDYPKLLVLDSTHPASLKAIEKKVNIKQCLFLVSSKSGTTLETLSFFRYFWEKVEKNTRKPGNQFIAVTDPNSPLVSLAQKKHFRAIFLASSDVGGRYSIFSCFGLLPAALIGIDLKKITLQAVSAVKNISAKGSEKKSDSLKLGAALGEIGRSRDKITFFISPSLSSFADWLEQLIAESLGKDKKGIVPVVNEPELQPENYGQDRLFIFIYDDIESESSRIFENKLLKAEYPVISISLSHKSEIGREIFRWEVAVASAGSILSVHPFNQPDVQLTKALTAEFMSQQRGSEDKNREEYQEYEIKNLESLNSALDNWLNKADLGCYLAIQAFLAPSDKVYKGIDKIRQKLQNITQLATTIGFGPRFLHSTGQLHKGGPNTGLFLQLVDKSDIDLSIPGEEYTFGSLMKAQSLGDFFALKKRNRPILRINLGKNVLNGLDKLAELVNKSRKVSRP